MVNSKFFAAAIVAMCAAMFVSCSKEQAEQSNALRSTEIYKKKDTPEILDRKADNQTITLSKNETFSFTENLLIKKGETEEWTKGDSFSYLRPFGAKGEAVDTVYTDATNFTANLVSREGSENVWEDGAWGGTQVDSTYSWQITNGEKTFSFTTVASASDAVYSGEGYEVVYPMLDREVSAELSKAEKMTVLGGKTYKETDFVHTSKYVFTVPEGFGSDSKSIELVNKLVVLDLQSNITYAIENENYVLDIVAEGNRAYADVQKNFWDIVVYDYDTEISREGNSLDLALSAEASNPARVIVKKDDLGKLTPRTLTHGANKISEVTDGDITKTTTSLDYVATFNGGNAVTISTLVESAVRGDESLRYAKIQNVRFIGAELASKAENSAILNLNFDVDFECPEAATKAASSVDTRTITVAQEQVARYRVPSVENGKPTVKTYEGDTLMETETFDASSSLTANSASDIYAANANFETTVKGKSGEATVNTNPKEHWTVTRKTGKYTSTNSNGVKSQDNVYNFGYDEVIVYKNGDDIFTFNGTFVISEGTTSLTPNGVKDIDGIYYDVTAYSNSINAVYEINNVAVKNHEDGVAYNILVEREVPHIIPEEWGKPVSYGVSAVPAHSIGNGYADGNSDQTAHKAHCFAFENGAVVIVTPMETVIPTADQIIEGYFVPGNYKGYNSGVDVAKNGKWIPAVASDNGGYLKYRLADGRVRAISNETLTQWGWRNGNFTTVVEGYSFSVSESGVLTVICNGEVVLQIR